MNFLFFLGTILKSCACVHSASAPGSAAAAVPVRVKNLSTF